MTLIYWLIAVSLVVGALALLRRFTSLEFVGHAKLLWRAWSVRLGSMAAAAGVLLEYFPDATLRAWENLPADAKSWIPPDWLNYIPPALMVLGIASQFVRQAKLNERANDHANTDRPAG